MKSETYYLENFCSALRWITDRYDDLLSTDERAFIARFDALAVASQALLVRLLMRKGHHFRASKIAYPEIGSIDAALAPMIALRWVETAANLSLEELFEVMTRAELAGIFPDALSGSTKANALQSLQVVGPSARSFDDWYRFSGDRLYTLTVSTLCTRLRLLFFGNFTQEWSAFVLMDLGILRYETVQISRCSRAFDTRRDIDAFFTLHECSRRLEDQESLENVLDQMPRAPLVHEWLEERRAKLLFRLARRFERQGQRDLALTLYLETQDRDSRWRAIRVMETGKRYTEAHRLASEVQRNPLSQTELRSVQRMLRRLDRRMGTAYCKDHDSHGKPAAIDVVLDERPVSPVEYAASKHLASTGAPVFYVENALINSLFGLSFWDAIFAPVPGAFFNPFQAAPLDIWSRQFRHRREHLFADGFQRLVSGEYLLSIRRTFREKRGLQSPFVRWSVVGHRLLNMALACIPPDHLALYFEHLLADLQANRCGLPDLIQFWPTERRYRLIEVKGPGDRLRENQRDWFDYCSAHSLPILVCHVRWGKAMQKFRVLGE